MNESSEQMEQSAREARLLRCERWIRIAVAGWIVTAALLVAVLWMSHRTVGTVHAHRLIILDDAGKERIVLAAPLGGDAVVEGRSQRRRVGVSAAVQFKEADGTERGGIALEDDGSMMFGIDDEHGRERAHLYYLPKRGSGVYLQSPRGGQTLSLLNPSDVNEKPSVKVMTQSETVAEWPPQR